MLNHWDIGKPSYRDFGDEAEVFLVLTRMFPGIGGTILTKRKVPVAIRQEFSFAPGHGKIVFITQTIVKKLDDFFHQLEKYEFQHIPRPFGSATISTEHGLREVSCYQWCYGNEGFNWFYTAQDGRREHIALAEWNMFTGAFAEAGIDVGYDCIVPDGEASKNIIHAMSGVTDAVGYGSLNCMWQRIDFGPRSIIIRHETLARFIKDTRDAFIRVFGSEVGLDRYDMLRLSARLLAEGQLNDHNRERLEELVKKFRISTLSGHTASFTGEGIVSAPLCLSQETE